MGLNKAFYYGMYVLGFALMSLITLRRCRKKGIERKKGFLYVLFTFAGGLLGAMLMGMIYTAAARRAGVNDVSFVAIFGAVIFTPFFLLAALAAERRKDPTVRVGRVLDCVAPGSFAVVICGKFGCFLYGCCFGVDCARGVYNPLAGRTVFPVQLFEVLSMLVVLALSYLLFSRPGVPEGAAYPVTAALYAPVRFCWEFFRYYPSAFRHFALGMTFWQLCCVLVFAVSLAVLGCLFYKNRKKDRSEFKNNP